MFGDFGKPAIVGIEESESLRVIAEEDGLQEAWFFAAVAVAVAFADGATEDGEGIVGGSTIALADAGSGDCESTFIEAVDEFAVASGIERSLKEDIDGDFGRESSGDGAAEVAFVLTVCGVGDPAELIGAAVKDFPVEPFHIEVVFDEGFCEVVKECGIDGWVGEVEVIGGTDDAGIEVGSPDAVNEGFGEEGIFG